MSEKNSNAGNVSSAEKNVPYIMLQHLLLYF